MVSLGHLKVAFDKMFNKSSVCCGWEGTAQVKDGRPRLVKLHKSQRAEAGLL